MLAMSNLPVVLFDLDGTLTDPKEGITRSIAFALERMARVSPDTEDLRFAIGPPLRDSFATLLGTDDAREIELAMTHYRERYASIGLYENTVYPGIPETLEAMKSAGCRILLATAKPHVYARTILEHFALSAQFDEIYGCELDGTRQHKTELVAYLLKREHVNPVEQNTVMIGDRVHDIVAAHANRCEAIGVTWGYGSATELQHANAIADQPADIAAIFAARYSRTA
jgi:phosphoglycolate phosphatase